MTVELPRCARQATSVTAFYPHRRGALRAHLCGDHAAEWAARGGRVYPAESVLGHRPALPCMTVQTTEGSISGYIQL